MIFTIVMDKSAYSYLHYQFSQDFRHEVNLLVKLRHPNIVQFLGAVTEKKPLMLITEYLRGVIDATQKPVILNKKERKKY